MTELTDAQARFRTATDETSELHARLSAQRIFGDALARDFRHGSVFDVDTDQADALMAALRVLQKSNEATMRAGIQLIMDAVKDSITN